MNARFALALLLLASCQPKSAPRKGAAAPSAAGAPGFWDGDMPASTTYALPAVASGQTYWKLVSALYYPAGSGSAAGGDHHIFFQAKDESGALLQDQLGQAYLNGSPYVTALTKGAVDQYKGNIPIFGSGWCGQASIDDVPGPYGFGMIQDGLPSVRVDGMGLWCNQHLTWWLVFQRTVAP